MKFFGWVPDELSFEDDDGKEYMECPECDGTGRFIYDEDDEPSNDVCFKCGGTGKIEDDYA